MSYYKGFDRYVPRSSIHSRSYMCNCIHHGETPRRPEVDDQSVDSSKYVSRGLAKDDSS